MAWHFPGQLTLFLSFCLHVQQVLVGAHAVLANGGVIAPAGVHMVALAAKRHSVPFVVLVGLHKLSPLFPHDPDVTFNGEAAWCMGCEGAAALPCSLSDFLHSCRACVNVDISILRPGVTTSDGCVH